MLKKVMTTSFIGWRNTDPFIEANKNNLAGVDLLTLRFLHQQLTGKPGRIARCKTYHSIRFCLYQFNCRIGYCIRQGCVTWINL